VVKYIGEREPIVNIVVISMDRLHYTLTKISQILKIHFAEISIIYKTSNKNRILNEFDKSSKLKD